MLSGEKVRLRALEPEDLDILYRWENDPEVWGVSGTLAPFSRETLGEFIENQKYDIYRTRQMRLVICRGSDGDAGFGTVAGVSGDACPGAGYGDLPVGFIDLFDFDPVNLRAGVGVLIYGADDRGKGYASEALELVCGYVSEVLGMHSLWCSVRADNFVSIELFRGRKFDSIGRRRDWIRQNGDWFDEIVFQRVF